MAIMELGEHYKLHYLNNTFADEVLISAHGGWMGINARFAAPGGVKIMFYAPEGYTLSDPGVRNMIVGGGRPPFDTIEGGECQDYSLSKYQGRHGNKKETYSSIDSDMQYSRQQTSDAQAAVKAGLIPASSVKYSPDTDVLTIRNRPLLKDEATLSGAIAALLKVHPYKVVHCSFCRSTMSYGGQVPTWNKGAHAW